LEVALNPTFTGALEANIAGTEYIANKAAFVAALFKSPNAIP